ncbi:hypothetical protein BDR26DRAFT_936303 [Obelidium mucronatum]|nr:hypothetical protein BDR26DRAFT_936303 [Obelidium mucronatum]
MVKRGWQESESGFHSYTAAIQPSNVIAAKRFMPSFGFSDKIAFPSFESLPNRFSQRPSIYYSHIQTLEGSVHAQQFSETDKHQSLRRIICRDSEGVSKCVELNTAQHPLTFDWTDLKPGSCLAILYGQGTVLSTGHDGVFVSDLDSVFVFHCTMDLLRYYASSMTLRVEDGNSAGLSLQAIVIQWLLKNVHGGFGGDFLSFSECVHGSAVSI